MPTYEEMEQIVYDKIDALQAEIEQRRTAIQGLLTMLPCEYIIVRTFVKDWECHRAKCSTGHTMYFSADTNGFVYDQANCHYFKSIKDANFYLENLKEREMLKDYVSIKIERVSKREQ